MNYDQIKAHINWEDSRWRSFTHDNGNISIIWSNNPSTSEAELITIVIPTSSEEDPYIYWITPIKPGITPSHDGTAIMECLCRLGTFKNYIPGEIIEAI